MQQLARAVAAVATTSLGGSLRVPLTVQKATAGFTLGRCYGCYACDGYPGGRETGAVGGQHCYTVLRRGTGGGIAGAHREASPEHSKYETEYGIGACFDVCGAGQIAELGRGMLRLWCCPEFSRFELKAEVFN